jgi:hypothetical protein
MLFFLIIFLVTVFEIAVVSWAPKGFELHFITGYLRLRAWNFENFSASLPFY